MMKKGILQQLGLTALATARGRQQPFGGQHRRGIILTEHLQQVGLLAPGVHHYEMREEPALQTFTARMPLLAKRLDGSLQRLHLPKGSLDTGGTLAAGTHHLGFEELTLGYHPLLLLNGEHSLPTALVTVALRLIASTHLLLYHLLSLGLQLCQLRAGCLQFGRLFERNNLPAELFYLPLMGEKITVRLQIAEHRRHKDAVVQALHLTAISRQIAQVALLIGDNEHTKHLASLSSIHFGLGQISLQLMRGCKRQRIGLITERVIQFSGQRAGKVQGMEDA